MLNIEGICFLLPTIQSLPTLPSLLSFMNQMASGRTGITRIFCLALVNTSAAQTLMPTVTIFISPCDHSICLHRDGGPILRNFGPIKSSSAIFEI